MPVSRPSTTRSARVEVARVDVGDQAVLGVVGRARAPRPRRRSATIGAPVRRSPRAAAARRAARRSSTVGCVEVARPVDRARPPVTHRAPCATASSTSSRDLVALRRRRSAARPRRRPRCRARPSARPSARRAPRRTRRRPTSCTRKRLAAVHASPMLRIFASIAPSTAASRSASSKTRNGALPPSSIDMRSSCVGRLLHQLPADLGRAGERQLAQPRVGDQRLR